MKFNTLVMELTIAASALGSARLPAAEPPGAEVQVTQSADKNTAAPREWASSQIFKELGAVEARVGSIDQFFKNHPEQKTEAARWQEKRAEVERFRKEADKQMEGGATPELRLILGSGLAAVNTSLTLYNDHLSTLKPVAPASTSSAPATTANRIGIYDVGDFEGMKTSAIIFRTLLEQRNKKNNTAPDAMQQAIFDGLSKIESARDPGDLAEKLRPAATELIANLADQKGEGAKGIRESLKRALSQDKGSEPKSFEPAANQDQATAWKSAWEARVASSTKLNKSGREIAAFGDVVLAPDGMKLVQTSASKLLAAIKTEDKELIEQLTKISTATEPDGILKPANVSLSALRKATEMYQNSGQKK